MARMANDPQWITIHILRSRGLMVAYGYAMPVDIHTNVAFVGVEQGISVPISRGSPPLLKSR
jgi:hypothetical protein